MARRAAGASVGAGARHLAAAFSCAAIGSALPAAATCGRAAQGLPFHTATALTVGFEERSLRAFGLLATGDSVREIRVPVAVLPWSPHARVNVELALPIAHRRVRSPAAGKTTLSLTAPEDLVVAAKWTPFVRDRAGGTTRVAVRVEVSLPTGSTDARLDDGRLAPAPFQPGRGRAVGAPGVAASLLRGPWGLTLSAAHRLGFRAREVRFGGRFRYDVAAGVRFPGRVRTLRTRTWQVYLEWNGRISGEDRTADGAVPGSGGHAARLSPGVQWVPLPYLLVEASLQLPVDGPEDEPRPAIGVRYRF